MNRVFVHGFALGPSMWQELCTPDDVCLTLPGHNGTPAPTGGFEEAVAQVAEHVDGAHVIGYSMGGRIALAMALLYPERVARLTLLSCHAGLSSLRLRRERALRDEQLAADIERRGMRWFSDTWEQLPMWATQRSLPEQVLELQRNLRRNHKADDLAAALRVLSPGAMPDYAALLATIRIPVDVAVGQLDKGYLERASQMAANLPNAELHRVPGCGHNIVLERPNAVARILEKRKEVAA